MKISRRRFIQNSLFTGIFAAIGGSFLARVAMAEWPAAAFDETEYEPI